MYCQKCRSPLKLHPSLEDQLNSAAINLLLGPTNAATKSKSTSNKSIYAPDRREHYERGSQNNSSAVFKRTVPGVSSNSGTSNRLSNKPPLNPAESYVLLTESQLAPPPPPPTTNTTLTKTDHDASLRVQSGHSGSDEEGENSLSQRMKVSARIFEVLSARSDIDHPICAECTDVLLEGLTARLANATRERDAYVRYLKEVNASVPSAEETAEVEKELAEIRKEEAKAMKDLKNAEKEQEDLQAELRKLEEESKKLDEEETAFWRSRNDFALTLNEFQNERDSVNQQYDHDAKQLERLQRTNVYNDTFCIGHDGYFGTINGLRLGRLSSQPVEWTEINAAWGQTVLLLATIAEKLHFTFQGYKLKPLGSHSKIERLEPATSTSILGGPPPKDAIKVTVHDLFSSGDLALGRMFMHRRFEQGMVAFLECLRQLGEYVEEKDPNLKIPYRIQKDRIGDASIKLGLNPDEQWTKACKYTLTVAKYLLAHAWDTPHQKQKARQLTWCDIRSNIGHARAAQAL